MYDEVLSFFFPMIKKTLLVCAVYKNKQRIGYDLHGLVYGPLIYCKENKISKWLNAETNMTIQLTSIR